MEKQRAYRLVTLEDLQAARSSGLVPLAPIDEADGYVHMSPKHEALITAGLYFEPGTPLFAPEFDADELGARLVWEVVPTGGARRSHTTMKAPPFAAAVYVHEIVWDESDGPVFGTQVDADIGATLSSTWIHRCTSRQ